MRRKIVWILFLSFIGVHCLNAQEILKGVVITAEDGSPIVGASVVVKGKSVGTATDVDGRFEIKVPVNTELVVSYIGCEKQQVKAKQNMRIALRESNKDLNEVVVVAYGTQKKESVTGAIAVLGPKDIDARPITGVTSALEGKAAGVQINNTYGEPGATASIRIRGFSAVTTGSDDPLYVIDGVPFGGNISDLNPQDIESLTVLKDAASSALYGNRASNGVVLITTKRGKSNQLNINVNVNQGFFERGIKEYERLGPNDYMEVMWRGLKNSYMSQKSPLTEADAMAKAGTTLIPSFLGANIYNKADDKLFDANGKLVSDAVVKSGYTDLDWYKYAQRTGYRQEYNFSADAANEKANYMLSVGYLDEQGYIKSSDFNRWTGRASVNVTPTKWFKSGLNISGSYQNINNTSGGADYSNSYINPFMFCRQMAPIYSVFDHDPATGEILKDALGNYIYSSVRKQYNGRNQIWESELNIDETKRTTLQSQAYAEVSFLKDFKFTVKGDFNNRYNVNRDYDNAIIGDGSGSVGRTSRSIYRYLNYTFQQQLFWSHAFGKHNIDVLAGHENYSYLMNYDYTMKTNQIFANQIENSNFTKPTTIDGYEDNYRTESYLSRARYSYAGKYFGEASFRRDGSSKFAKDNRWGNFWSVGGSWMLSSESFMSFSKNYVDFLKLRASYGEVGNDQNVGNYASMALYSIGQNGGKGSAYKLQNSALSLLWETAQSFNIGMDTRLFDRANLTVEYFDKRSKDLLFDVNLPLSAGGTDIDNMKAYQTKNIGVVSNKGIEVSFDVDAVRTKNFVWNIGANGTWLKNEIMNLPNENKLNGIISGTKKYMEGHGIYDYWVYQYEGVDQMTGRALYQPDTEKYFMGTPVAGKTEIPTTDWVEINGKRYVLNSTYGKRDWSGSAIPKFYGGLFTSLKYHGLTLSAVATYGLGGKVMDNNYMTLMSVTSNPSAIHKDILKSWNGAPQGITLTSPDRIDPNGTPIIDYNMSQYSNVNSTRFLKNGSYFVLKNVTLSYDLPHNLVSKLDLNGVKVNFSVENPITVTSLQGMNPQQSWSGVTSNVFVTARVYSMGVNVRF